MAEVVEGWGLYAPDGRFFGPYRAESAEKAWYQAAFDCPAMRWSYEQSEAIKATWTMCRVSIVPTEGYQIRPLSGPVVTGDVGEKFCIHDLDPLTVWFGTGDDDFEIVMARDPRSAARAARRGDLWPEAVGRGNIRAIADEIIGWGEGSGEAIFAGEPYEVHADGPIEHPEHYDGGEFGPVVWPKSKREETPHPMTTTEQERQLAERVILALLPSEHPERRLLRWFEYWGRCDVPVLDKDLPGFKASPFNGFYVKGGPEAMMVALSLENRGLIARHPQRGWFLT